MTENAQKAAESVVDWMDKEGVIDLDDGILKRQELVTWIGGIIDVQYGTDEGVTPVSLDELEESLFNEFNERLRFDS